MRRTAAAALALTLALAPTAWADPMLQVRTWASGPYFVTMTLTNQTDLVIRFENPQSVPILTGWWEIRGLAGLALKPGSDPNGVTAIVTSEGDAGGVVYPGIKIPGGSGGLWWLIGSTSLQRQSQPGDGGWWIAGCDPLTPNPFATPPWVYGSFDTGYLYTCNGGVLTFHMTLGHVEFTDTTSLSMGVGGYCTGGPDCPTAVTPEPATVVLLATGMAGVLGWRRRRRLAVLS